MTSITDTASIEPILRRFHQAGVFETLDTSALDRHLGDGGLDDLMAGVSRIRNIVVELADPEYDMFRSYQLYVGLELYPGWHGRPPGCLSGTSLWRSMEGLRLE